MNPAWNMINTDAYVFVQKEKIYAKVETLYSFSVRCSFDGKVRITSPQHKSFIGIHIDDLIADKSKYYDCTKID